jgi:mannose-6-phosphate isomerase-like protein (cupin superfamily)
MSEQQSAPRQPIYLPPGDGRTYAMGRIRSVFKADGDETEQRYSISEWWLEPNTTGPGPHSHDEDDVFYVLDGVMSFLIGDEWVDAPRGSFVLAPGGVTHDFQNRGTSRAGVLNVSVPGAFERSMPGIVQWFNDHPAGDVDSSRADC